MNLMDSWGIYLVSLLLIGCLCTSIWFFFRRPTKEQLTQVSEWLLWAVIQAENQFGGGTGELKLQYVYDAFIVRFPWLTKFISFQTFCLLVDKALDQMKELLETNLALNTFEEL